jgi:pyruvate dehydrogenase E2 component (dihydrolipoamide acetyltransferase)
MGEFRMPSLGADMEAGTLVEWRVQPGDVVKRGDIVALVETEKGVIEVEIFDEGLVEKILVQPGTKVPVGTALAVVRGATEAAEPTLAKEEKPAEAVKKPPAPAVPAMEPAATAPAPSKRAHVSPVARRKAEELSVDVSLVVGTGPDGSITLADVERAASKTVEPAKPAATAADRQAGLRRAIAAAMARSKKEIPHYYVGTEIDMSRAMAFLAGENANRPVTNRLLYSALLIRAVALAIREVPEVNGFWIDGGFKPSEAVHVGVAISLRQGGLVAPALHDVDKKNLDDLMREMLDLVNRARTGMLRSSEMSDPTITVTNLGEQGVETVFGVIYPPQVALVGFGKLTERAWATEGKVVARAAISASLAADHRVSDGHRGGRFLAAIDRLLQAPEKL